MLICSITKKVLMSGDPLFGVEPLGVVLLKCLEPRPFLQMFMPNSVIESTKMII